MNDRRTEAGNVRTRHEPAAGLPARRAGQGSEQVLSQLTRRLIDVASTVIAAVALGSAVGFTQSAALRPDTSRPVVTQAEFERWQTELSNWGRWGKEDEIGALNLITPAKRKQALSLVKDGFTVSLASDAATKKDVDVPCPNEWAMVSASDAGATDRIAYPCIHGAGTTHLDAFGHIAFNGRMWNGYPMSLVTKESGASKNSILR